MSKVGYRKHTLGLHEHQQLILCLIKKLFTIDLHTSLIEHSIGCVIPQIHLHYQVIYHPTSYGLN